MAHVWDSFCDLQGSRELGQLAQPISYREIEAYRTVTGADLAAWEVRLIKRLDDAVLPLINGIGRAEGAIPASNGKAISAIFKGLAARKKGKQGAAQPGDAS